jgi:hypothetical protein
LFAGNAQDIYLHDLETGAYHNLNNAPYNFVSSIGVFDNRFELMYQGALTTTDPNANSVAFAVVKTPEKITVNAAAELSQVTVYDLRGRVLAEIKDINVSQVTIPISIADQVVLVKVKTTDGKIGIKKAL